MSHTVRAAMEYSELSEEEAYFLLRFAGRVGYERAIRRLSGKPLHQWRRWLIWIGGWENPELTRWDRGKRAWEPVREWLGRLEWASPYPISLFGHRITFFGSRASGNPFALGWFQVKSKFLRGVITWYPYREAGDARPTLYWSPDGTPSHGRAIALWPRNVKRYHDDDGRALWGREKAG